MARRGWVTPAPDLLVMAVSDRRCPQSDSLADTVDPDISPAVADLPEVDLQDGPSEVDPQGGLPEAEAEAEAAAAVVATAPRPSAADAADAGAADATTSSS